MRKGGPEEGKNSVGDRKNPNGMRPHSGMKEKQSLGKTVVCFCFCFFSLSQFMFTI